MNNEVQTNEDNVHGRIDQGAERIKQATSDAVASSKEKFDRAADRVEERVHHATDKVAEATERGREAYDHARERADEWLEEVREYVREKPVQAVAIALGAGWLLGRILRR